jgi:mannose-6-phosphate isomerase
VTHPPIERYTPRELGPKAWGQELLVAETPHYIGKVLRMRAGASGPLQYHERKEESFHLFSGEALVRTKGPDGTILAFRMLPGETYHIPPGAIHQVEAMTDCVFFEASTPVFDDRVPA